MHRVRHTNAWLFSTMLISSLLSLLASFVLAVDALRLAEDPAASLSCNINAVLNCGAVATSWQAQALGFPNAFLGLMAEPVIITIAAASLGGVIFPRWFMFTAQAIYLIGFGFAYWLFFQSMFVIGSVCPWCLLVTVSTTAVFATLTHINIRDDNLFLPRRLQSALSRGIAADFDLLLLIVWLLSLVLAVVLKYGEALFA